MNIRTIILTVATVLLCLLTACAGMEKRPGLIEFVASAAKPGIDVKVLTFNIRYGTADDGPDSWRFRQDFVAEVIAGGQYDIVGMQEVLADQLAFIAKRMPGYQAVGVGRDDGKDKGEFSPILIRADRFEVVRSGTFWLSETPEKPGSRAWGANLPRICTWAELRERKTGHPLWAFNTHLDHQSALARERSVELITARIREMTGLGGAPLVFTGDFNAGENSAPIRYVKGADRRASPGDTPEEAARPVPEPLALIDTFRVVYPDATEVGTFNEFKGKRDGAKIDFIFVPKGSTVMGAEIIRVARAGHYPSDHFPVNAAVKLIVKE